MQPKISPLLSFVWTRVGSSLIATDHVRRRPSARLRLEALESRVTLSTFIWTALATAKPGPMPVTGTKLGVSQPFRASRPSRRRTPTSSSPARRRCPAKSSTTIDFNFAYLYMPLNSLTIEDPLHVHRQPDHNRVLAVDRQFLLPNAGATPATITLAGLKLAPGVVINTATGSTLQLGSTTSPTALQLTVQGPLTKSGGGQLAVDTQSVYYSELDDSPADPADDRRRLDRAGRQRQPRRCQRPDQFQCRACWSPTMWRPRSRV